MSHPQPTLHTDEANIIQMTKFPQVKGKQYLPDNNVDQLAEKVMKEEKFEFGPAEIEYLLVYPNISKYTACKTKRTTDLEQHYSGNHYVVLLSGELWDMLDDDTRYMLLWHSLLKIDPVYKAKKQEWKFKTRKPDVSLFYEIAEKHDNNWYKTIQATTSSLYDLDPKQENKVKA